MSIYAAQKTEYIIMNRSFHRIKRTYASYECLPNGSTIYIDGEPWEVVSNNGRSRK